MKFEVYSSMRFGLAFLFFFTWSIFNIDTASAHTRRYVFSEEYRTIPQGQFELESWVKMKVPDRHITNKNTFEYQEELEYGITDRWVIAHYEQWLTTNVRQGDDRTEYKGFKFETKYRLGEKGKYWLDPLVYLEWATDVRESDNPNAIEGKIVLSKDIGRVNFTYNQVMDSELGSGGRTEHNFTFGANIEGPWHLHAGLEGKGNYWKPGTHRNQIALGPTVAWEHEYFWVAAGAVFGVNRWADDVEGRIIVGIPFG